MKCQILCSFWLFIREPPESFMYIAKIPFFLLMTILPLLFFYTESKGVLFLPKFWSLNFVSFFIFTNIEMPGCFFFFLNNSSENAQWHGSTTSVFLAQKKPNFCLIKLMIYCHRHRYHHQLRFIPSILNWINEFSLVT